MSRDPAQRIADVLEAVERCRRYVAALDGDADLLEMAEDAIERNLQIIGEAVNHLPT
ncbi:MAG: HepT-like ribonuclease domain-containing protein, partial [Brachybacterium tyrofermentans]